MHHAGYHTLMIHTIKVHLEGASSLDDKVRIETEIEVLAGGQREYRK